jgi:TRAP-type C4-dicarboxylate transport system permease small subunit
MIRLRGTYERLLEWIVIVLMTALALEVILGVAFRYFGTSLVWYDEVASILLAWLTYYGAALAALKGAHIGVPEVVALFPRNLRVACLWVSEGVVFAFMGLLAWSGWMVMDVLATDFMVSLPEIPMSYVQSVIPLGAVLYMLAELARLPQALRDARSGTMHVIVEDE